MPLHPEHIQPMIDTWRKLANHYHHVGNSDAATRVTRLADQLEQMTLDGSIRYSPDALQAEPMIEVNRQCCQCHTIQPSSRFPRNRTTQMPGRQCRNCLRAHPSPSKQNRAKKPAIMPIDTDQTDSSDEIHNW